MLRDVVQELTGKSLSLSDEGYPISGSRGKNRDQLTAGMN
jgi:hypothetical protein